MLTHIVYINGVSYLELDKSVNSRDILITVNSHQILKDFNLTKERNWDLDQLMISSHDFFKSLNIWLELFGVVINIMYYLFKLFTQNLCVY